MDRRAFLATLSSFAALDAVPALAATGEGSVRTGQMVRSIGVLELEEEMARVRQFYRDAGVRM